MSASRKRRRRRDGPSAVKTVAWALSLSAHCGLVLWGATTLLDREVPEAALSGGLAASAPVEPPEIVVDLMPIQPPVAEALVPHAATQVESRPELGGGEGLARPDSGRSGRGGERDVDLPAVNLAPGDDLAHLTRAERSHVDRAQEARRKSGDSRRSRENDTVTPRPTILTFWAEGRGERLEPRPWAPRDPAGGRWRSGVARDPGMGAGRAPREPFGNAFNKKRAGNDDPGNATYASAGPGVIDGAPGYDAIHSADVAAVSPLALKGRASTRARERGAQEDDVDSEQAISSRDPSLLAASTAGGETGEGRGGEKGPGKSGSGGVAGSGSKARPMGYGKGPGSAFDPADARRRSFYRKMRARLHGSWSPDAFPKWAVLQGRGGSTIVGFVVQADGSVTGVRTLRPSGFPDFDAKMRAAVRRAAPFGKPPSDLRAPFATQHEFAVANPAVRPVGR